MLRNLFERRRGTQDATTGTETDEAVAVAADRPPVALLPPLPPLEVERLVIDLTRSDADGIVFEALRCEQCHELFDRPNQHGRSQRRCATCRAAS